MTRRPGPCSSRRRAATPSRCDPASASGHSSGSWEASSSGGECRAWSTPAGGRRTLSGARPDAEAVDYVSGMAPPRRNVELKARDPDPDATLRRALELGASDEGVLRQRDTYFGRARGRLKLREQEPGGAQLIAYQRADDEEARTSAYRIAEVGEPTKL